MADPRELNKRVALCGEWPFAHLVQPAEGLSKLFESAKCGPGIVPPYHL